MRQRITFIHEPHEGIDPNSLVISESRMTIPSLKAARQDRILVDWVEIDSDVQNKLMEAGHFTKRIVWPEKFSYKALPPFSSRDPSGVSVYKQQLPEDVNQLLAGLHGKPQLGTEPPYITETMPNNLTRSELYNTEAQTDRQQILDEIKSILKQPPSHWLKEIDSATWIEYGVSTRDLKVDIQAYWEPREWSTTIGHENMINGMPSPHDRIEIGIFGNEAPAKPVEVKLSGYITLLGTDMKPKPALFWFSSRHHAHTATYGANWVEPTGLHPTLGLQIDSSSPPEGMEECQLYAHFTLPKTVFPDRYQFQDSLFMASKNLSSVPWISEPVDLEAPAYAVPSWGSNMILELAPPPTPGPWTAEVPLHLRYLEPSESGYATTEIPTPIMFWGCEAEDMDDRDPFSRYAMQYEEKLPQKNVFFHLQPEEGASKYLQIKVPVLSTEYKREVEVGTAVVVVLGFGWVLWKALGVWVRAGYGSGTRTGKAKIEEKKQ